MNTPLDLTFGQHPALPNDESTDDAVSQYLLAVRHEASADRPVYFVERSDDQTTAPTVPEKSAPTGSWHGAWADAVLEKFLALKNQTFPPSQAQEDVPHLAKAWREHIFTHPPPSLAYFHTKLTHADVVKLVVYLTRWLSASMPQTVSLWIYMVLLRLDKLLDCLELAVVRDLAKKAVKVRHDPAASPLALFTCDLVVVLVGRYFGQLDLLIEL